MRNLEAIANKVARRSSAWIEIAPRAVLVQAELPTGQTELKFYTNRLSAAQADVLGMAMRVRDILKELGHGGGMTGFTITPELGVVGVFVQYGGILTPEEQDQILASV